MNDKEQNPVSRRGFIKGSALCAAGAAMASQIFYPGSGEARADEKPENTTVAKPENGGGKDLNTGDIIVERLIAWDVKVVFGLIGDGVNHIIEAFRKREDRIRLVTVRHEEAAAFMAAAYAKYTGKLGVCIGTTGPGAVHLMNGIFDAAAEGSPVLAITGSVNHDLLGTHFTQEVDTVSLMKDCTVFNQMISGPRHAMTIVDLACRGALSTPGVAHLTVSKDVQNKKLSSDKASEQSENLVGSSSYVPRIDTPPESELDRAAALLNSGVRVAILAGRGALNASNEVLQVAGILGAPVIKALLGKAVLPDASPSTTGGTGHLGTLPSKQSMHECDRLLILGSTMPHLEYYPNPEKSRVVQVDSDARRIGLRYPVDIGLHGDVQATLKALLPKLKKQNDRSFLQLAMKRMDDWRALMSKIESNAATPVKPQFLVSKISSLLTDDALLAFDTGSHTQFCARHIQIRAGQRLALSGNLATMGPGLPYAIAAQVAFPDRLCVAMVGDGGFTMLMGEMATAVRYNLPIKVVVFKNNSLSMDRFEQEEMGYPPFGDSLQPIDFARVAEACGAEGYRCAKSDDVEPVLRKAFASKRPAVIEVMVDPDEPPLPPDKVKA